MGEALSYTARERGYFLDIQFNRAPAPRVREELETLGFKQKRGVWSGSKRRKSDVIAMLDHAVKRSRREKARPKLPDTLCGICAHAAKGDCSPCPWAREFKPVEGWTAEATRVQMSTREGKAGAKVVESYCVIQCPLYKVG